MAGAEPRDGAAIRIKGLSTRFGEVSIHDGLDLEVRRGEIMGVVGASGAGKSVLLRTAIGLNRAAGGIIEVLGRDVATRDEASQMALRMHWGVLFQDGALFSSPVNGGAKRDHLGGVRRDRLAAAGLSP